MYYQNPQQIAESKIFKPQYLYRLNANNNSHFEMLTKDFNIKVKDFLPTNNTNIIMVEENVVRKNKLHVEQKVIHLSQTNQVLSNYILFNANQKIISMGIVKQNYVTILYKKVYPLQNLIQYEILQWNLQKYAKSKIPLQNIKYSQKNQIQAIFFKNSFCILEYLVTNNKYYVEKVNRGWNYKNFSQIKIHYFKTPIQNPYTLKLNQTIYNLSNLRVEQILKVNNESKIGFITRQAKKSNEVQYSLQFLLLDLQLLRKQENNQTIQIKKKQLQVYQITSIDPRIINAQIHEIFQINNSQFYINYFLKQPNKQKQYYSYLWFPKQTYNNLNLMLLTNQNHYIQFFNHYRNLFLTNLRNFKRTLQSLYSDDQFYNTYNDGQIKTYIINSQNYTLHGVIQKYELNSYQNKNKLIRIYLDYSIKQMKQINLGNQMIIKFKKFYSAQYLYGINLISIFFLFKIYNLFDEDLLSEIHQILQESQKSAHS